MAKIGQTKLSEVGQFLPETRKRDNAAEGSKELSAVCHP